MSTFIIPGAADTAMHNSPRMINILSHECLSVNVLIRKMSFAKGGEQWAGKGKTDKHLEAGDNCGTD